MKNSKTYLSLGEGAWFTLDDGEKASRRERFNKRRASLERKKARRK
jgi:hypothetical protein